MSANNNDINYEIIPKKQKLDDIVEGSIVKVYLKNFMTFCEVEYTPQTKLNMIIGPNGSGKSSIVTALMLGFGGSPKDINRGDKVSHFIKTGTTVAVISIELYRKSQENIHLRREIFASNEGCHYYINNLLTTKTKYINVVESFNIRVHNLCQFLPQDRLEDFSKLDPKGLLLNALQSIENQDLLNKFDELKKLASSISTYDDDLNMLTKTIKLKTSANLKLETIVSSFTKKNKLEQQLLTVFQKRFWCLYKLAWKQMLKESKNSINVEKYTNNALNLIKQQTNLITSIKSSKKDLLKVVLHKEDILQVLLHKLNDTIDSAISSISDLNKLFTFVKSTSVKIEDYKVSIQSMEEKLKNIFNEPFNIEDCKQEFAEINKKITNIEDCINPLKRQLDDVKNKLVVQTGKMYVIDQEIQREKQKEESKNHFLQRKYPEMWKAMCWLRNCDKSSIFVGQVFDPLFTQIEVLDKKNANYIENIVNYRDMIAFVFEYAEDLTKFNKIIKQERWQKINSISAPPSNFYINETPNIDINILRQFGFHSYALDMIKVPPIIRRFLAKNYDMHNIPIGSQEVINNLQKLPSKIGFFFAGNDQIIIKTSSYTGEKIIRQTQISNDAQFLLFSVDLNFIQLLTVKKKEASAECENFERQKIEFLNQIKVTEDSRQSLFTRKKEIQGTFMKFQNRQNAYDKMIKDIEFARSELVKEVEKTTKFHSQYEQLINKYYVSMNEAMELFGDCSSHMNIFVASVIVFNNNGIDMHDEMRVLKELNNICNSREEALDKYLKYLQRLQCEFNKIEETALYLTHGVSPYDNELFEPLKEKFKKIDQDNVDEIDVLIVEIKAKLSCLNINPKAPRIIEEYKDRKSQIKDLESKFNDLNNVVQSKKNEIDTIHSEWFPKLQKLCNLLNINFQNFLISFGCCGVIELDVGITRYDYQAYGLLIKVQFRNEAPSLMMLDSKTQSGGERALTTALFLLTLQELTHFPFRIVDEINQGMDKIYERKLMELFMELFENRSNQYFIVTPKLIKNLTFKNTTVDIIYCIANMEE